MAEVQAPTLQKLQAKYYEARSYVGSVRNAILNSNISEGALSGTASIDRQEQIRMLALLFRHQHYFARKLYEGREKGESNAREAISSMENYLGFIRSGGISPSGKKDKMPGNLLSEHLVDVRIGSAAMEELSDFCARFLPNEPDLKTEHYDSKDPDDSGEHLRITTNDGKAMGKWRVKSFTVNEDNLGEWIYNLPLLSLEPLNSAGGGKDCGKYSTQSGGLKGFEFKTLDLRLDVTGTKLMESGSSPNTAFCRLLVDSYFMRRELVRGLRGGDISIEKGELVSIGVPEEITVYKADLLSLPPSAFTFSLVSFGQSNRLHFSMQAEVRFPVDQKGEILSLFFDATNRRLVLEKNARVDFDVTSDYAIPDRLGNGESPVCKN